MDNPAENDLVESQVTDATSTGYLHAYGHDSISTNAPGLRPSWPRLVVKDWRWFLVAIVPTALAVFGFYWVNRFYEAENVIHGTWVFIAVAPVALVALALWFLAIMGVRADSIAVAKGLLSPAIVSTDRRQLYCMANLNCHERCEFYGLKAIPFRPRQGETEVPCVSTFDDDGDPDHWAGFDPIPLRWGSSQRAKIDDCHQRIPAEMWKGLKQAVYKLKMPAKGRMLLLDKDFKLIEDTSADGSLPKAVDDTADEFDRRDALAWAESIGLLFIGLGLLVLGVSAFFFWLTTSMGAEFQWPPLPELTLSLAIMSVGLTGVAFGSSLLFHWWKTAGVCILIGIGLMVFVAINSPAT